MPEPVTTLGIGAIAAYLGKDGLQKILGPTAEYLGEGLKEFARHRVENVGRIFQNAERKLGSKTESQGQVPPKVLKEIINEGSYCNDLVAVEYFGGVLASSRTETGRDDRGARIAKLVDRLSTYQLRSHYLIYSTVRNLFSSSNLNFGIEDRPKMKIFIPLQSFIKAMEFDETERTQTQELLVHIFSGLETEDMVHNNWIVGFRDFLRKTYSEANSDGIICQPSTAGCELFMYSFGAGDKPLEHIFHPSFEADIEGISQGIPDAKATSG